jgi:hypothetical protein
MVQLGSARVKAQQRMPRRSDATWNGVPSKSLCDLASESFTVVFLQLLATPR